MCLSSANQEARRAIDALKLLGRIRRPKRKSRMLNINHLKFKKFDLGRSRKGQFMLCRELGHDRGRDKKGTEII
jgi:hypothetical protein